MIDEQLGLAKWLAEDGFKLLADAKTSDFSKQGLRHQTLSPIQTEMLKEQRDLRKRARRRFPNADQWIWTDRSLSQASDWWTANFKARLFPSSTYVLDACCGAGADLVAIGSHLNATGEQSAAKPRQAIQHTHAPHRIVGLDRDAALLEYAKANCRSHGQNPRVICAEFTNEAVQEFLSESNVPDSDDVQHWLHIDPDRRAARTTQSENRKTTVADQFDPSLPYVLRCAEPFDGTVIKVAPSTQFETDDFSDASPMNRMWIGAQGECKQQLLLLGKAKQASETMCLRSETAASQSASAKPAVWFLGEEMDANIDSSPDYRIAVVLQIESHDKCTPAIPHFAVSPESTVTTNRNSSLSEPQPKNPIVYKVDEFVHDLHPVLHASELQTQWADHVGFSALHYDHGYFTSNQDFISQTHRRPLNPWCQSFRVLDVVGWDDRKVRKRLRAFGAGTVEVKCRGLKIDANSFQRKYSRDQGRAITLLVTRLDRNVKCIIAERFSAPNRS